MAPIKQLILSGIEFSASARYIADIFRINGLATAIKIVKDETYSASYDRNGYYDLMDKIQTKALVKIEFWEDTEAAYNFIKEIRTKSFVSLSHPRGYWIVEEMIAEEYPNVSDEIEVEMGTSSVDSIGKNEGVVIYWDSYLDEEKELIRWSPPCCTDDWSVENCEYCIELDSMESA